MEKKVLLIVAQDKFKDSEYQDVREILDDYDFEIKIAAQEKGRAKGVDGLEIEIDMPISDVRVDDFEAFVFIGGEGSSVYFDDDIVIDLVKKANEGKKVLGAICIAPTIFANAGILKGLPATAFESAVPALERGGAVYTGASTESQGNIITADGPDTAEEFGEKIALVLMSEF